VKIGVTLPNAALGIDGDTLVDWGVRAEACGFDMVAAIDRVAYPSYEQLVTLAAIASRTQRVRLMTSTLLAPTRDVMLLAKQTATLDRLSNGRLLLGLSVGMRPDDFVATGMPFEHRGRRYDAMIEQLHALWRGAPAVEGSREVCPPPVNGRIPIYFGAMSAKARIAKRIARWGEGYLAVGPPEMVQPIVDAIRRAWAEEGRDGLPTLVAASYFALGPHEEAERNILDYYGDFLPALGQAAAARMPRSADDVQRVLDIYRDAGFDEFLFSGAAANPEQVDRLADVLF
jgi:alkanesulfonate monooxygenase SsuD/methylene tetrahydromethanopterin reductase-like flavin-dependent oxidoreductase (luciferase family)